MKRILCLLGCLALATATVHAEVKLHALFAEHAVLQRDRPLPVWGWADPGEKVTVTLGRESGSTTADKAGRWMVKLAAQPVSTQPLTLKVAGKNTMEVRDVLLGDVWLCGGQSNMEMALGGCNAPEDIQSADFPLIRHFGVGYNFASAPQDNVKGEWRVCSSKTAGGFTAVGFYFARRIQNKTNVPIGLLRSCVGGSNIELWMSQDTLLGTPELAPYAKQMRSSLDQYQRDLATALPGIEQWTARSRELQRLGQSIPLPPAWPEYPFGERSMRPRCVTLHNGMIEPLVPFALRGAIWYQGENNADASLYVEKKRAMLADWRKWFGDDKLPFYFVQLAAWQKPDENPAGGGWGMIRDAQRRCLAIPHTGMASAVDIGDAEDIHPRNKADVGGRLALWALANEYGEELEPSGPLLRELKMEGNKARVLFDHVGQGLMIGSKQGRAAVTEDKVTPLKRFAIAGADRQWRWAEARIDGNSVICTHADVPAPVAVRYAYSSNPTGVNLYNRDGLPASPFRTDNW